MAAKDAIVCDHAPAGKRAGTMRPVGDNEFELIPMPDDFELPDIVDDSHSERAA